MKTWMHRPALLLAATFLVVGFVAGFPFGKSGLSQAHAATVTPTISVSAEF